MQLTSHRLPEHVVIPGHDPDPEHEIMFIPPTAVMLLRHEFIPLQVKLQVEPPHWMPPVHALLPQVIVQVVASRQSIADVQPEAGHVIAHGIPSGHRIWPVHGLQVLPHVNVQVPLTHAPPASRQSAHVMESFVPLVQAVPGPAA
jgi:hypothetical protein